jgi:hypothetical protein
MRLLMLCGTVLWTTNNVISGSIGGVVLKIVVALMNASTIRRLYRQQPAAQPSLEA